MDDKTGTSHRCSYSVFRGRTIISDQRPASSGLVERVHLKMKLLFVLISLVAACDYTAAPTEAFTNVFHILSSLDNPHQGFVLCLANSTAELGFSLGDLTSFYLPDLTIQYLPHRSVCDATSCAQQTLWLTELFVFDIQSSLRLRDVRISGQKLIWTECTEEWCTHCLLPPFVWPGQPTTVIDRFPVDQAPSVFSERCPFNPHHSSFRIINSLMVIENSLLDNIRVLTQCFIELHRGNLTISNSTISRMDFLDWFINGEGSTVLLTGITVTGLNRDHSYQSGYSFGDTGFLRLLGVDYMTLEESVFEENYLLSGFEISVQQHWLRLTIKSCVFRNSMHGFRIDKWVELNTHPVFLISNCTFEGELANSIYFDITAPGYVKLLIEDCKFINVTVVNAVLLKVRLPDGEILINRTQFIHSKVYNTEERDVLFYYANAGSIAIENTLFLGCDISNSAALSFYSHLISSGLFLPSEEFENQVLKVPPQTCIFLFRSDEWNTYSWKNVQILSSANCLAAISVGSSTALAVAVEGLVIENAWNQGLNIDAGAVPMSVNVTNSRFIDIKGTGISLNDNIGVKNKLTVRSCLFIENSRSFVSYQGTYLVVHDSQFIRNTGWGYGAILFEIVEKKLKTTAFVVLLNISNCIFADNFATELGADVSVLSVMQWTSLDMIIRNSSFSGYSAMRGGSIYFMAVLFRTAAIQDCNFTSGQAANATGVIVTSHKAGVLILENVSFANHLISESYILQITVPNVDQLNREKYTELRTVTITNSTFLAGIKLEGRFWQTKLVTSNCRFEGNRGIIIWSDVGAVEDTGSLFKDNQAEGYPCYFQDQESSALFQSTQFRNNSATTQAGGCAYLRGESSSAFFSNCNFIGNTANSQGGALRIEKCRSVEMIGCKFASNSATSGSALIFFDMKSALIANSDFTLNRGRGVIELTSSNLTLESVSVADNGGADGSGLVLMDSMLQATGSSFTHMNSVQDCLVTASGLSNVTLVDCSVTDSTCTSDMLITSADNILTLTRCNFHNLSSVIGSIISTEGSLVRIDSVQVRNIDVAAAYLDAKETNLTMQKTVFSGNLKGLVVSAKGGVTLLSKCHISDLIISAEMGLLVSLDTENVELVGSVVRNVTSAHALMWIDIRATTVTITESQFDNLRGPLHGALSIQASSLTISDSHFLRNQGSDSGGGLGISAASALIQRCVFVGNTAKRGGAIYLTLTSLALVNNTFAGNWGVYGNSLASSLITGMKMMNISAIVMTSGQRYTGRLLLGLLDRYNQLVTTESNSTVWLFGEGLSGTLSATVLKGLIIFTGFVVTKSPGTNATLSVRFSPSSAISITLRIPVQLRNCTSGEAQSLTCDVCQKSTYSLQPGSTTCFACLPNADCPGDGDLYPLPAYWRPSQLFDGVLECPNHDACLGHNLKSEGSSTPYWSKTGLCAQWYEGNMCQSCTQGAGRRGIHKCAECPNEVTNKILITIAIAISLGVVITLTALTLRSSRKSQSKASTIVKIFLNYVQVTSLVASFPLHWPSFIPDFFSFHRYAGGSGQQLLSVDCLVPDLFFKRIVAMALLPIILLILNAGIWGLVWGARRSISVREKLVCSTIVSLFYFHISITSVTVSAFQCITILPGEQWLHEEMSIRCWDQRHSFFAFTTALPALVLWGLGIPALALLLLIKFRKRLEEPRALVMVGFLCRNYKSNLSYWEIITIYRKVCIIFLRAFMISLSPSIQTLTLVLLLTVSVLLQIKLAPFKRVLLNKAELQSLVVIFILAYAGLFYSFGSASLTSEITLLVIIILSHLVFVLFLIKVLVRRGLKVFVLALFGQDRSKNIRILRKESRGMYLQRLTMQATQLFNAD